MKAKSRQFHLFLWLVFHTMSCTINYALSRGQNGWGLDYFGSFFALPNIGFLCQSMMICYLTIGLNRRIFSNKTLLFFITMALPLFFSAACLDYFFTCILHNCTHSFYKFFQIRSIINSLIVLFGFMVTLFIHYLESEDMKNHILQAKNELELAFLKSQINPHFLFNTLNNLYGLSLSEPDKAPDAILKLSEMMRYMLYESSADRVLLAQEIAYLKNYIELQKLRYEGNTYIKFEVHGDIQQQKISPLLLISFVENAFKHGAVFDKNHPLRICLTFDTQHLTFETQNKIHFKNKEEVGGIGIKNVKRRLEMLYPKQHVLNIQIEKDCFETYLEIEL